MEARNRAHLGTLEHVDQAVHMWAANVHTDKLVPGLKDALVGCTRGFLEYIVVHGVFCEPRACDHDHAQSVNRDVAEKGCIERRVEFG